jgi:hypothetical protein
MNSAQLHLILTHLPLAGLAFVILLQFFSMFYVKSNEFKKVVLWMYVVLGFFALLAYLTGDGAEELMKTYPGITEDLIEPHENVGFLYFLGLLITSIIAIIGLYMEKKKEGILRKFLMYLLIASILLSFIGIKTGDTGGKIRHTEIEHGVFKKV